MPEHSQGFQLFPYFVCRVSGLPTDSIESLKSKKVQQLYENFTKELRNVEKLKNEISDDLFNIIKNTIEKRKRSTLISFRRDLFNGRKILKCNEFDLLTKELQNKIEVLKEINDLVVKLIEELKASYHTEKQRIRKIFIEYLKNEDFQKGLLISSKSLYSLQGIYKKASNFKQNKRIEQIERGLLRYFTRTAMKATPFGTFCAIIPGKVNGFIAKDSTLSFTGDPQRKKSLLLINKDIYGIISNFIRKDKSIRKKLSLELNKTIDKKDNIFYFLTEINGKEVFQRIEINPVLELLITQFEENPVIVYEKLINNLLIHNELEVTKEEAEIYLDRLIEHGFIRFKIGIPEQQVDWTTPLCEILKNTDLEKSSLITNAIVELKKKAGDYESSHVHKRIQNIEEITAILEKLFKELNITDSIRSSLPLYEDATANAFANIDETRIIEVRKSLFSLIQLTNKLGYPRSEHANMRYFFDKYYKEFDKEVSLLQFYEDYYREHFKSHLEKQQKAQYGQKNDKLKDYDISNPFGLDLIKKIHEANKNISKIIIEKWIEKPDSDEILITVNELQNAINCVEELPIRNFSVSIFSQLFSDCKSGKENRIILANGHYMSGFGKYFSRFLYLFDKGVLQGIYDNNNKNNGEILAEISGDANFNANLHPQLLKYEISYPTTETGLAETPLQCTDIIVEIDPDDTNRLKLKHKPTGSYIVPLDLGFLNPMMRPPLFQLLTKFSPPCSSSFPLPEKPEIMKKGNNQTEKVVDKINDKNEKPEIKIVYRPRIIFDERIVLSRQCWFIPKELFPQITNDETDFEYFLRVNKWREENNIPYEVYVKIRPLPLTINDSQQAKKVEEVKIEQGKSDQDNKEPGLKKENKSEIKKEAVTVKDKIKQNKFSRDYYKPQYIDFFNPLLVDLFGKITAGLKNYLVTIEERYPDKTQLPSFEEKTFAVEQIFQIDFKNN
jgi:hypothetical protein